MNVKNFPVQTSIQESSLFREAQQMSYMPVPPALLHRKVDSSWAWVDLWRSAKIIPNAFGSSSFHTCHTELQEHCCSNLHLYSKMPVRPAGAAGHLWSSHHQHCTDPIPANQGCHLPLQESKREKTALPCSVLDWDTINTPHYSV